MDMMRITAMIFVMVFHINYYSIGLEEGTAADYSTYQLLGFSLMKCVSMVCVNMFILISGWYSIKPTVRGLIKLTFQIWFFSIPTYLCIVCLYDDTVFSLNILLHLLIFGGYWFIPAYLLLYISSKKAISLRADILINRGGGSFETHTPACPNGYSKWSIRFNNVIISSSSFKTQTGVLRRLKR